MLFGVNYETLVRLKKKHDPHNIFHKMVDLYAVDNITEEDSLNIFMRDNWNSELSTDQRFQEAMLALCAEDG
jgi:hypothetical protein